MCTLIAFVRMDEKYPLVIASNRDENPRRPTREPRYIIPTIFAPQDEERGGTWIGVNKHGMMAAITNRRDGPHDRIYRSRGLLVTDALAQSSIEGSVEAIEKQDPAEFNGFHLFMSDRRTTALIWNDGEKFRTKLLSPGLHIITGLGFEPEHCTRDRLIRLRAAEPDITRYKWLENLLTFHEEDPEDGTCVHGPGLRMESCYSLTLHLDWRSWLVRWRSGRPCRPHHSRWNKQLVFLE